MHHVMIVATAETGLQELLFNHGKSLVSAVSVTTIVNAFRPAIVVEPDVDVVVLVCDASTAWALDTLAGYLADVHATCILRQIPMVIIIGNAGVTIEDAERILALQIYCEEQGVLFLEFFHLDDIAFACASVLICKTLGRASPER